MDGELCQHANVSMLLIFLFWGLNQETTETVSNLKI